MQKTASLLFLLLIASACQKNNNSEKDLIKKADWLIGNWETKNNIGTLSENWEKVNDSTFKAQSLFIKDKDTIHNESIILQQKGETLSYTTTIKGQNNNKPIRFELNTEIENELLFQNLKNDYPQKISYKKTSKNSLITQISGIQSGKTSTEKYNMVKTK
ncbi:hypothetical protein GCM10008015_17900 [Flavobacterium palustre]|uniref:DUF6265 domain-containing protein n=1 Tax=Flavobacterium palustre TaxID=1476463 RepID=A0ABQ1HIA0_9FLAO|nr:DUF6265 family protein [Flavobacterium palustre]GGA77622.1 hypothetical protein GCM10008015_17900 [Flavobacterium palustre]